MNTSQWLQIAEGLRQRIRVEPARKVEFLLRMADAYLKARYYRAAQMVCRTILKLEPCNAQALCRLGRCLLGQKQFASAEKLYATLGELVPSLDEAAWGLWASRKEQGNLQGAAAALEAILEQRPQDERARREAANAREAAGDRTRAIFHLETLYDEATDDGHGAERLGRLLVEANEPCRAMHYFERALTKRPHSPELLQLSAETASSLRDYQKTARLAAARLEAGTFSPQALELLARARMELEEHDGAILALERLVDRAPDKLAYRLLLAEAFFRAGELRDAEVEYNRCLARCPDRAETVLRLGEIAWQRQEHQKAEGFYERCLKLCPGATLALYRLGRIKYDRHLYPAALSCFRRLIVAQPENGRAHLYLGRCLRVTGSFDRARTHLQRARELMPQQPAAEFELGLLDLELHRTTLAREHFQQAQALDPEGEIGKRAAYELRHLEDSSRSGRGRAHLARAVGEVANTPSSDGRKRRWIKLC